MNLNLFKKSIREVSIEQLDAEAAEAIKLAELGRKKLQLKNLESELKSKQAKLAQAISSGAKEAAELKKSVRDLSTDILTLEREIAVLETGVSQEVEKEDLEAKGRICNAAQAFAEKSLPLAESLAKQLADLVRKIDAAEKVWSKNVPKRIDRIRSKIVRIRKEGVPMAKIPGEDFLYTSQSYDKETGLLIGPDGYVIREIQLHKFLSEEKHGGWEITPGQDVELSKPALHEDSLQMPDIETPAIFSSIPKFRFALRETLKSCFQGITDTEIDQFEKELKI